MRPQPRSLSPSPRRVSRAVECREVDFYALTFRAVQAACDGRDVRVGEREGPGAGEQG